MKIYPGWNEDVFLSILSFQEDEMLNEMIL